MNIKNKKTKNKIGIVYLFTNELYERENMYKYGITINPFQRKRVQSNSTPPTYPFYDRIVMFSKSYKDIERRLKQEFNDRKIHLDDKEDGLISGQRGGQEWIQERLSKIVEIFKDILKEFPDSEMCFQGKRYKYENDEIKESRLPNCELEFLGILDGDTIKCIKNGMSFQVQNNAILVEGEEISLSNYMKMNYKREGNTNEWNGFKYFTYKGYNIYNMWQSLVRGRGM